MAQPDHQRLKHIQTTAQAGKSVVNSDTFELESLYGNIDESSVFKGRYRSLELAIINGTTHNLRFDSEYFYSGTWFCSPDKLVVKPGSGTVALVANRAGSAYGVTGGWRWKIEGTTKYVVMGFTNPSVGCYKTSIQCTSDKSVTAESGYDCAYDDSVKFKTENGFILSALLGQAKRGGDKLIEYIVSIEAK